MSTTSVLRPKLFHTLKTYDRQQFARDAMSGVIVGIVAIPLAIAFAIASGVSPDKGLFTAVIAGFMISLLGGSRVQIGGPTGAFIVIVYGIVQQYGISGLIIATFIAGVMLILMGLARLGAVIKFIPHPLIVGFTSGIALIIFSSQVKDFLGLKMGAVPAEFTDKWVSFAQNIETVNLYAVGIAVATVLIIMLWPKITHKIPGSLIAIILTTVAVYFLKFPVETIGSKFGEIPSSLPSPVVPKIDFATIRKLIQPAFTIALLGGIESLLSCVVADGMIGSKTRNNMELIAQGVANIFSSMFGGIPATGAIARTVTNVKNGGRTPVAGIIHAITLLFIMLFFGKWATYIPMPTLAGVLVVVAYNMSEWENFRSVLKGPRNDSIILLTTFFLTVFIDLTVAIEIGMVLAAFLFMRKMIQSSEVSILSEQVNEDDDNEEELLLISSKIPKDVEVFEITGPLFFGAAHKFTDAIKFIEKKPKVLIIRMRYVPMIDQTGIHALEEVFKEVKQRGIKVILSEVNSEMLKKELQDARLLFAIGKANVTDTFDKALERCTILLEEIKQSKNHTV